MVKCVYLSYIMSKHLYILYNNTILLHTLSTSSMARHSSPPTVKTTRIKFTIVVPEIYR